MSSPQLWQGMILPPSLMGDTMKEAECSVWLAAIALLVKAINQVLKCGESDQK